MADRIAKLTGPQDPSQFQTTINEIIEELNAGYEAELDATLADGDIFVGNAGNVPVGVTISGDATMTNAGVMTVTGGGAVASVAGKTGAVTLVEADITDLQSYLLPADIGSTVQAWSAALDAVTGTNTGDETAGTIKTKYESNADTNAFTDAEKTNLGNQSGTNTGDQTSIVGITGTKAEFDTAVTDGDILYVGDAELNDPESFVLAASDETTALTTGTAKLTFRMPYAFTLTAVRASVNTAPTDADIIIDINEGGVSILSTKLSIDATEKTSTTAVTPAVISDASLADDAEITIDIDQIGSTIAGAGLKIVLIGNQT